MARILKDMCREMEANPQFFDSLATSRMSDQPDVWTDDSCVVEVLSEVGSGACGLHGHRSGLGWFGRRWGHPGLLPVMMLLVWDAVPFRTQ